MTKWDCDYCGKTFENQSECAEHEEKCSKEPFYKHGLYKKWYMIVIYFILGFYLIGLLEPNKAQYEFIAKTTIIVLAIYFGWSSVKKQRRDK